MRPTSDRLSVAGFLLLASASALTAASDVRVPGHADRQRADEHATETVLRSFVEDFRHDPMAETPWVFGVRVAGENVGSWHVRVTGLRATDQAWEVTLEDGPPPTPAAVYVTDIDTLRRIEAAELNALTAMAKARASDTAPLELEFMEGFDAPDAMGGLLTSTFHFWTRGAPEVIRFGESIHTRDVHGGLATVFYYQEGLRSAWYQLDSGQHVNKEPRDQVNPFPTLVIMTGGTLEARFGGRQMRVSRGEAVFIPPGMAHEFWNPYEAAAEFVILMFGAGA